MSVFEDPAYMADSKAGLVEYMLTGKIPTGWLHPKTATAAPKRAYRHWTREDHRALALRLKAGETITSAAVALGLPVGSCGCVVNTAGGRNPYIRKWLQEHV